MTDGVEVGEKATRGNPTRGKAQDAHALSAVAYVLCISVGFCQGVAWLFAVSRSGLGSTAPLFEAEPWERVKEASHLSTFRFLTTGFGTLGLLSSRFPPNGAWILPSG